MDASKSRRWVDFLEEEDLAFIKRFIATAVTSVGFILRAGLKLYTQSNFFSHVQHGMHLALQERGLNTVFLGAEDDLDETNLKRKLRRGDLYGVVVLGEVAAPFLNTIKRVHQRVVTVSASYPGLCQSVLANEAQAAELLVAHLTGLRHKSFAWLGGNRWRPWFGQRTGCKARHRLRRRQKDADGLARRHSYRTPRET